MQIKDLFLEPAQTPHIITNDGKQFIVLTHKIINTSDKAETDDTVLRQATLDFGQEYANRLLSDFSSDYDVRVKYRLLGLAD